MDSKQFEFIKKTSDAIETCVEIQNLLVLLKDFCAYNEENSDKFSGLVSLTELLLSKNDSLFEQINDIEIHSLQL